jgi:hypothetical protein
VFPQAAKEWSVISDLEVKILEQAITTASLRHWAAVMADGPELTVRMPSKLTFRIRRTLPSKRQS